MVFINANDSAMGNSNFERNKLDFYPTPEWITEAVVSELLKYHVEYNTLMWEPACGEGHISRILHKYFTNVMSTDIADYKYLGQDFAIRNFLDHKQIMRQNSCIITNPPYGKIAELFIRHALEILPDDGVCVFLMRNEYDCAKTRVDLFRNPAFCKKLVLTTRPKWIENSDGSPRHNYSWYIWDKRNDGKPPVIKYHVKD